MYEFIILLDISLVSETERQFTSLPLQYVYVYVFQWYVEYSLFIRELPRMIPCRQYVGISCRYLF